MSGTRQPMRRSSNDESGMNLPAGKTCGDCARARRCTMMFGHIPSDEVCDWSPSRFNEKTQPCQPANSHFGEKSNA